MSFLLIVQIKAANLLRGSKLERCLKESQEPRGSTDVGEEKIIYEPTATLLKHLEFEEKKHKNNKKSPRSKQ